MEELRPLAGQTRSFYFPRKLWVGWRIRLVRHRQAACRLKRHLWPRRHDPEEEPIFGDKEDMVLSFRDEGIRISEKKLNHYAKLMKSKQLQDAYDWIDSLARMKSEPILNLIQKAIDDCKNKRGWDLARTYIIEACPGRGQPVKSLRKHSRGVYGIMKAPRNNFLLRVRQVPLEDVSETERVCKGPRLVVHVGPHKTGTSAFQYFLMSNEAWLQNRWGVSLGFRGNPKATGRDIARPILNSDCAELTDGKAPGQKRTRQELKKAFDYTKSKLESSSIVLLSSEAFSIFSSDDWECFSHFMGNGTCLSAVVLHRDTANWMASDYAETTKNTSIPQTFAHYQTKIFGRKPDKNGETDKQLQLLSILEEKFSQHVVAASYDYLKEEHCSVAAFVICNASLRMTGQSWKECRDSIDSRSTAAHNLSPPRAAIDVVVLAKTAYEMKRALRQNGAAPCKPWPVVKQTPHVPKGTLISSSPAVLEAAKQLPLRCESMNATFRKATDEWFARTKARRPRMAPSKPMCRLDVDNFGAEHWRVIFKLLPDC
ncbi:rplV [Symbiodinium sp. CCMP2592]|nr:rplV [Symbiodinium sp. CCMP2592]